LQSQLAVATAVVAVDYKQHLDKKKDGEKQLGLPRISYLSKLTD
jgi:hypothetical protein